MMDKQTFLKKRGLRDPHVLDGLDREETDAIITDGIAQRVEDYARVAPEPGTDLVSGVRHGFRGKSLECGMWTKRVGIVAPHVGRERLRAENGGSV